MSHNKAIPKRRVAAARPRFLAEDIEEILDGTRKVLESGWLILGAYTREFEDAFKNTVGTEHAVAVSSCTAALQIALRFFRVAGREVLLPTNNFPGVVSAVLYEGGVPVLAEMDSATFGLDVDDAISRVTSRTAGIIVVHVAGLICPDIDRLRRFCRERGLFLIEDAAHALGAEIDGRPAGSLADAGCFSFYPTKVVTTGTGGMMTTDNTGLADFARSVRHHGQGRRREEFVRQGNDWCLSEIQAVVGLQQLKRLKENVTRRNELIRRYRALLRGEERLAIPEYPRNLKHAYYKFPIMVADGLDRNRIKEMLNTEFQIENGTIFDPPCHLQPVFRELFAGNSFPKAESGLARQLCPPIHSSLSDEDIDIVVEALRTVLGRCSHT